MSTHTGGCDLCTHTCDLCTKTFTKKGNLKRHMLTHESNCYPKSTYYTRHSSQNLKRHFLTHEFSCYRYSKEPYICDLYQKNCSRKDHLKRHSLIHKSNPDLRYSFASDLCSQKFTEKGRLKRHTTGISIHKPNLKNTNTYYNCDLCQKNYSRKDHLKRHSLIHESDPDLRYPFACDLCSRKFAQKEHLKRHIISIHEPNLKNANIHYTCDLCQKNYSRKDHLQKHFLIHESDPDLRYPFACDLCSKKFTRKEHLKRHIISIHEPNLGPDSRYRYLFTSDSSTKKFNLQKSLETHMSTHESNPELKYTYCTRNSCLKKLSSEDYLKEDTKMHQSNSIIEKSIECKNNVCKEGLILQLKKIVATHEANPNLKTKFICDLCKKIFVHKVDLKKHISIHDLKPDLKHTNTNFDLSQKKFSEKRDKPMEGSDLDSKSFLLKKTFNVEFTQENDISSQYWDLGNLFTCSVCQRRFIQKEVLKNHLLTHT